MTCLVGVKVYPYLELRKCLVWYFCGCLLAAYKRYNVGNDCAWFLWQSYPWSICLRDVAGGAEGEWGRRRSFGGGWSADPSQAFKRKRRGIGILGDIFGYLLIPLA